MTTPSPYSQFCQVCKRLVESPCSARECPIMQDLRPQAIRDAEAEWIKNSDR